MRVVCAFCNTELQPSSEADDKISHGICKSCMNHAKAELGVDLTEYIDMLEHPVLLVDDDVRVKAANGMAKELAGKDTEEVIGYRAGEIYECEYAQNPEGCGGHICCSGCAIRKSVTETYQTGRTIHDRPACITRETDSQLQRIDLFISTRKAGNVVLLEIIPATPACAGI